MFPVATAVPKVARHCFGHFCLRIQVLLCIMTFSHGLSRYPWQTVCAESGRVHFALREAQGLPRLIVHFLPTFHVLLEPLTLSSSATSIKFCQGFLRWNVDDRRRLNLCPRYKKRSQSCCKHCISLWEHVVGEHWQLQNEVNSLQLEGICRRCCRWTPRHRSIWCRHDCQMKEGSSLDIPRRILQQSSVPKMLTPFRTIWDSL